MQQPEATESIMETPAGSRLGIEESAAIEDALTFMLDEASQDRDGEETLSREGLQTYMSNIMQQVGMEVMCDAPLPTGGAGSSEMVLDVAANADGQQTMVRIEQTPSQSGLDEIYRLLAQLKAADVQGRLYLATDILNGNSLVLGPLTQAIKSLMDVEGVGVILVDKLFILICQNHDQLMLEEMPHFIFPSPQAGQAL